MFDFKVVTPDGVTYQDEVIRVTIPTTQGEIMILEGHAQLIATLGSGELIIDKKDIDDIHLAVTGGVVEVRETGEVYVLADNAERAEDIDLDRAKEARARAEKLLKEYDDLGDDDFARIQVMLRREATRISVGNKYRK